ncbi:MAG: methyltransferase domain-containing protein [Myxococcota bacterium]
MADTESGAPSPFFLAHRDALEACAQAGPILDLASGRGRHALAAAAWGATAVAVDRDRDKLSWLRARAAARQLSVDCVLSDLETDLGIPIKPGSCSAILVFHFLFRPLAPTIETALHPGGLLLYETFTERQSELASGPRNPAFLLAEGELPALFPGLEVIEFEEIVTGGTHPQALARLCARRGPAGGQA